MAEADGSDLIKWRLKLWNFDTLFLSLSLSLSISFSPSLSLRLELLANTAKTEA